MFALGEVAFLYCDRITILSIAFAMLVCLVIICARFKKKGGYYIYLCFFLLSGFFYIYVWDYNMLLSYREDLSSYNGFGVYVEKEAYNVAVYGKKGEENYIIRGEGVVVDYGGKEESHLIIEFDEAIFSYRVILYCEESRYELGTRLELSGRVYGILPSSNPGVMNLEQYYRSNQIVLSGYEDEVMLSEASGDSNFLERIYFDIKKGLYKLKEHLKKVIFDISNEDVGAFIAGVLLGDRRYIEEDIMELFQLNGVVHILAISGMHISLIGRGILKLLRCIGLKLPWASAISVIFILLYGEMTGLSNSTLRAIIMLTIAYGADVLGRSYDMHTSLGIALFIMLIGNPYRIMDGGMLLSFGAIGGIILGRYIETIIKTNKEIKRFSKKRRKVWGLISSVIMSGSVTLFTLPILANLYYQVPLYSLLSNLLIVPFMSIVIMLGALGIVLWHIVALWGVIVYVPLESVYDWFNIVCRVVERFPFAVINTGKLSYGTIVLYYGIILMIVILIKPRNQRKLRRAIHSRLHIWLSPKKWRRVLVATLICICIVGVGLMYAVESACEKKGIYFLDVGQGDGILIKAINGSDIVVDGGSTDMKELGKYTFVPALKSLRMSTVDYWFLTHGDMDHTSAIIYILTEDTGISIDNIVVSDKYSDDQGLIQIESLAREKNINFIVMSEGDYVDLEYEKIYCVAPKKDMPYEDVNQASMGLYYKSQRVSVLFTGDMDSAAVETMLSLTEKEYYEEVNILKVPHHGSKYSYSSRLYELCRGGVGIISVGANNNYGHPGAEVLQDLEKAGVEIFRTDLCGCVLVEFR